MATKVDELLAFAFCGLAALGGVMGSCFADPPIWQPAEPQRWPRLRVNPLDQKAPRPCWFTHTHTLSLDSNPTAIRTTTATPAAHIFTRMPRSARDERARGGGRQKAPRSIDAQPQH